MIFVQQKTIYNPDRQYNQTNLAKAYIFISIANGKPSICTNFKNNKDLSARQTSQLREISIDNYLLALIDFIINNIKSDKIIDSFSMIKTFKVHVENVVGINIDGLDFSNIRVQIRNSQQNLIKTVPLNQLSQTILTIETSTALRLSFSLLEVNNFGSRQYRVFSQGSILVQSSDLEKQHNQTVGCTIRNIVTKKAVVSLAIRIKQDLEKIYYYIPDSEPSMLSEQQSQKIQTIQQTISNQSIIVPEIKKQSPTKRNTKRPIRNRYCEYLVKSENTNVNLTNKVVDDKNISIEGLQFEIDEPISSIQFHGKAYQQMLAQIFFNKNPTQEELKNLKLKIPENEKVVEIHLKTLEGTKIFASANLPNIQQNQSLKICSEFKDKNNEIRGRIRFIYKEDSNNDGQIRDRMLMGSEVRYSQRQKVGQHRQFIPFLFSQSNLKLQGSVISSPRTKLPKILIRQKERQHKFSFQTINQKIIPKQKSVKNLPKLQTEQWSNQKLKPTRSSNYEDQNTQAYLFSANRNKQKSHYRSKTIHSKNYSYNKEYQPPIAYPEPQKAHKKSVIKITGVAIKFTKPYLQKKAGGIAQSPLQGKFLQIYSNSKRIYRSQVAYAERNLNWKLINCQIQITEYDNLTFQLSMDMNNVLVGEHFISYNQLKFNQQENTVYFGYLTHDGEVIAKIFIQFEFIQQDSVRVKDFDKTPRARISRFYSEDIAYDTELYSNTQNKNKTSLYSSSAIPVIPQIVRGSQKKRILSKKNLLMRDKSLQKTREGQKKQKYF